MTPSIAKKSAGVGRFRLLGPPLLEAAAGFVFAEGALLEAELEQEGQRPPDDGPGRDAEAVHDGLAVEVGPDGLELLGGAQGVDARLQLVHAGGEGAGLALVAGGAVAAGQLDQLEVGFVPLG